MLNLTSYMDETGHSDDPTLEYVGMAGFIAPYGAWEIFESGWADLLRNGGLNEPFHMKEFAHFTEQFKTWRSEDDQKRKAFMRRAMELIAETSATPIGAAVSLSAFRSLTPQQQINFLDPYYLVFQTCTRGAAIEAVFEEPKEKVSMVYARHEEYGTTDTGGRAEQLWYAIKAGYEHGNRMGSYASGLPRDKNALQAADIFAWELSHEFESRIKRPDADMRWPLRQILGMYRVPDPRIILFDRRELLRRIKESHYPDQTGVSELDDNQESSAHENMMKWLKDRGHYTYDDYDRYLRFTRTVREME